MIIMQYLVRDTWLRQPQKKPVLSCRSLLPLAVQGMGGCSFFPHSKDKKHKGETYFSTFILPPYSSCQCNAMTFHALVPLFNKVEGTSRICFSSFAINPCPNIFLHFQKHTGRILACPTMLTDLKHVQVLCFKAVL